MPFQKRTIDLDIPHSAEERAAQTRAGNLKKAFAEHNIPWPSAVTLFSHPTGPLLQYVAGALQISDLNPELHTQWRMSRKEMFMLGWRCIRTALTTPDHKPSP